MPELPEVETVRAGLLPHLGGQMVTAVQCGDKALRHPYPEFSQLIGHRIVDVRRRAKYLLIDFEHGITLVWHLGMTGQFHVLESDAPVAAHEHVKITLSDAKSLRYRDARRFGFAGIVATGGIDQHAWFNRLGPEPFDDLFDAKHLQDACRGAKRPIKTLIMDQQVVVGVGNIYACEALFRSGIDPRRRADRIAKARIDDLVQAIKAVLAEAVEAGGSTIRDFVHADGKPGYFAHSFQVYGREGEPCCSCGETIRRVTQSGRSSFFCKACQK